VNEFIAKTFVIVFVLIYVGLLAALFGWNLWKQLGASLDKRTLRHLLGLLRHTHSGISPAMSTNPDPEVAAKQANSN
jgi:hypothetical protein